MGEPTSRRAMLIESLGVYLPPRTVATDELMRGCRVRTGFPLERMSGIKTRRVAGDTEFGIDLAERAIVRCLERSSHAPEEVELLVIGSVGRCDGPGLWVSHEPSTALRLRQRLGLERAIVFDLASACSGMFTGLLLADALIRRGAIRCALVASGEYISHLGLTAQKEIREVLDARLACLTLGDAGAAVMLEGTDEPDRGFDALGLTTFGAYARLCMAYPTREAHGGAIMVTDALNLTEAATRQGAAHALETLREAGWSPESFQHLIMHQTSSTALTGAMREINRVLGARVCHPGNTIDNLAHRGNTASTSHFVALADSLSTGRIRTGDRAIFAISGSGLTVGTALYTFDDLPGRLAAPPVRKARPNGNGHTKTAPGDAPRIRIESVGIARGPENGQADTFDLLRQAATDCLARSGLDRGDLAFLIYAGVYRTAYLSEPAIAALLAGELEINATSSDSDPRRTLAFDISNGAVGFLNACHIGAELIRAGRADAVMVVTSEVENNAERFPGDLLGIEETGSAVILTRTSVKRDGFGSFRFRADQQTAAFASHATNRDGTTYLVATRDPALERRYLAAIVPAAKAFLADEGLELGQIARVLPPQISPQFITDLVAALELPRDRFVDVTCGRRDLFTSSVPFAFRGLAERGLAVPGEIGLVLSVGSGIQVGCALYHF
jgi:3-oxoacyl-[acyl-carrier-protein] synthase III